jgi:hypothetical protein
MLKIYIWEFFCEYTDFALNTRKWQAFVVVVVLNICIQNNREFLEPVSNYHQVLLEDYVGSWLQVKSDMKERKYV